METVKLKHLQSHQSIANKYDKLKKEIWSINASIEDENRAREAYISE